MIYISYYVLVGMYDNIQDNNWLVEAKAISNNYLHLLDKDMI